jgi:hypothetical protein
MWQIAYLWNLIPDGAMNFIVHGTLVAGVIGILAGRIGRWITFFRTYAVALKIIGYILLVAGIYLKGGLDTERAWRDRVQKLEAKVAESEKKSRQFNQQLNETVKQKNQVIKDSQRQIQTRIQQSSTQIDRECRVDPEAIAIHNDSARTPGSKR